MFTSDVVFSVPPLPSSMPASSSGSTEDIAVTEESSLKMRFKRPLEAVPVYDQAIIQNLFKPYEDFSLWNGSSKNMEKFNADVFQALSVWIAEQRLSPVDFVQIDDWMYTPMEREAHALCRRIGDFSLIEKKNFVTIKRQLCQRLIIASEGWSALRNLLLDRVVKLATGLMSTLIPKKKVTLWTNDLKERIENIFKQLIDVKISGAYADSILRCRDRLIRSLILRILNPEEEKAAESLQKIREWSLPIQFQFQMNQRIASIFKMYKKLPELRREVKTLEWNFQDQSQEIDDLVRRIDVVQVARSFIAGPEPIYTSIFINGEQVPCDRIQDVSPDDVLNCQRVYFYNIFSMIYLRLLANKKNERSYTEYVKQQVSLFLDTKSSQVKGFDILVLATNSCWMLFDLKFKALFPSLYSGKYLTRTQSGIACAMEIESPIDYRVMQEKTLLVCKKLSPDPDSYSCDSDSPLFSIVARWQVEKKVVHLKLHVSFKLSLKLQKLQADEHQEYEILKALADFVPIPDLELALPSDEHLRRIFGD